MRISRCSFVIAFLPLGAAACAGSQSSDLLDDGASNAGAVPDIGVGREARTSRTEPPDASIRPPHGGQDVDAAVDEAGTAAGDEGGSGPDPTVGGGAPPTSTCPSTTPPPIDLRGVELCHHPTIDCWRNDDCTAGAAGRCIVTWDGKKDCASGTACSYDACATDADCPSGGACQCAAGPSGENLCL